MKCLVCQENTVRQEMDLGRHAVASFFLRQPIPELEKLPVALGQCQSCGTIQSTDFAAYMSLIAPHGWVPAREPEDHLDKVVETISGLIDLNENTIVAALSYKDDTTVRRFMDKGAGKSWRADLLEDFGVDNPNASNETVQALTTPERMKALVARRGQADIFIARHILEHAEDPVRFMKGLAECVREGGLIMLEVPDCTTNLRLRDYCMIWEEHALYFTPATFQQLLPLGGFSHERMDIFPLPFENSLVLLGRKSALPSAFVPSRQSKNEIGLLADYADAFDHVRQALRSYLQNTHNEKGPLAIFGAGHLAHAFVNFYDVADLFEFIADDTESKQGKLLAGTTLPILPSQELCTRGIKLCLLALSIKNEDAVISRNQAFLDQGGAFSSIFRASSRSIFEYV